MNSQLFEQSLNKHKFQLFLFIIYEQKSTKMHLLCGRKWSEIAIVPYLLASVCLILKCFKLCGTLNPKYIHRQQRKEVERR
jgi:hypothetical protein